MQPTAVPVAMRVFKLIQNYAHERREEVSMSSSLIADLALCSLDVVSLALDLECEFVVQLHSEDLEVMHTVGDVVRVVTDKTSAAHHALVAQAAHLGDGARNQACTSAA